jgi:bacterial/archaeal transporter family-2 protein
MKEPQMPGTFLLPAILVLMAGSMMAVQPPTNAYLARASGSVMLAALISFAVGTVALLALTLASQRPALAPLRELPWYAWLGGLYGAFFVAVATYAAPRLGIASMITLAVAGQMVAALAVDHFGALGLDRNPLTMGRFAGALLVIAGVILVRRG